MRAILHRQLDVLRPNYASGFSLACEFSSQSETDVSEQLYGRIRKEKRIAIRLERCEFHPMLMRHVRLLHFGLDTPKSMTLGYIANLSANK
jgi:hypothetical protein